MLTSFGRYFAFGLQMAAMTFCLSNRVEAIEQKPNADSFHPQIVQADVTEKFTDVSELLDIQPDNWNFKGKPPKLIRNNYELERKEYIDKNTSLHLEAFYRFNLNENVAITPGIVVITNPEHNNDKDTIVIGTLRTTFSF